MQCLLECSSPVFEVFDFFFVECFHLLVVASFWKILNSNFFSCCPVRLSCKEIIMEPGRLCLQMLDCMNWRLFSKFAVNFKPMHFSQITFLTLCCQTLIFQRLFPKIGKLPFITLLGFQFFHSEYFVTYKVTILWIISLVWGIPDICHFLEDFEDIWKILSFAPFVLSFERFGRFGRFCLLRLLCLLSSTGNFTLSSYASKGFRIRNVSFFNCFQKNWKLSCHLTKTAVKWFRN